MTSRRILNGGMRPSEALRPETSQSKPTHRVSFDDIGVRGQIRFQSVLRDERRGKTPVLGSRRDAATASPALLQTVVEGHAVNVTPPNSGELRW